MKPRIYYDQFDIRPEIEVFEEGAVLPFDKDKDGVSDTTVSFPNGFLGIGSEIERVAGAEVPFDYELFDKNILTVGLEYRLVNQGDVRYQSNFNPATYECDSVKFLRYLSVSGRGDLADMGRVFAGHLNGGHPEPHGGVRHDQYSDFMGQRPRTGLTWAFMKDASPKLLYPEAFRARILWKCLLKINRRFRGMKTSILRLSRPKREL